MECRAIKFLFDTAVHFGDGRLDTGCMSFCADTLFSALYQEALKDSQDRADEFYKMIKNGQLLFSDAFPFSRDTLFLPKPVMRIDAENNGNSVVKKAYKKLKYIPMDAMKDYLHGKYDVLGEKRFDPGKAYMKVQASIRGEDETLPYRINCYRFNADSGLYIILSYNGAAEVKLFEELLRALSYAGIGGKRSSGMGRFDYSIEEVGDDLKSMLMSSGGKYMTLSVSLPNEEELDDVIDGSSYVLCKRSGFVASEDFADEYMRKNDCYMFQAGSCFSEKFDGEIVDVSGGRGRHPVYRYGKPLFIGVGV